MMLGMTTERTAMAKWYWVAVICGGFGIFEATQTVVVMRAEGMHHAWTRLFITILLSWVPWAVAAQAVMQLGRNYPVFHRGWASAWVRHGVMWMAILISATTWNTVIEGWLNPWTPESTTSPLLELWRLKFTNEVLGSLILYAGILLVGWILDSRERLARQRMEAAQLSEQLTKAQWSALRQQIEPHFLFNTLNTIAGLVREGRNDDAVDMIAGLSELLRGTLKTSDRQEVKLGEELEIVKKYLEIEKSSVCRAIAGECTRGGGVEARAGAEPDLAADRGKRGKARNCETGAGRRDWDLRGAIERRAYVVREE